MTTESNGGKRGDVPSERRAVAPEDRSWLTWAARAGYAACGAVYLAIGLLAGAVAVGAADRPGGASRAIILLARQPFGEMLVMALAVGLLGYAGLNLSGALRDPEKRGVSMRGLLIRAADALTGALYIALAVAAIRTAAAPSADGGRLVANWAAGVIALPYGGALLAGLGFSLAGAGAYLVYRARAEPFQDILDRRALSSHGFRAITAAARFGTLARGVILSISGLLAVEAAVTQRPDRVGGIGAALSAVETTVVGAWALGFAAAGFIAYGVYQIAKVRYRRVQIR